MFKSLLQTTASSNLSADLLGVQVLIDNSFNNGGELSFNQSVASGDQVR